MTNISICTDVRRHSVIYAGHFVDRVRGANLPNDCTVLGEQDTLPYELDKVLNHASMLVFLDLLSFPFEAMSDDHWDIPVVAMLPSGFDAESLITTFGSALFERLGFFDCIVTSDVTIWEELRRRYSWAESQLIPVAGSDPGEVPAAVGTVFGTEPVSLTTSSQDHYRVARHWYERNRMLADSVSYRAVHKVHHDPRLNKALHRVQAEALKPQFAAPRWKRDTKGPIEVLEVGAGTGRWTSSFDLTKTRFFGIDTYKDRVETARANFPEQRFDNLGCDLLFPYSDESFDLVFGVSIMQDKPAPTKATLLSEMWRVARPGGRLLFLENFVFTTQSEESAVYPISVTEFVNLVLDATAGQVTLEHMESLRYQDEDLRRGGLISLLKLGVPKTQQR